MTALSKYKHFIGLALLAVYAFIATPVQLWHYHHDVAASIASFQPVNKGSITAPYYNSQINGENCQVCSHHYSIYRNDVAPVFEIFIPIIPPKEERYTHAIPLAPYFHFANKGPPSVA